MKKMIRLTAALAAVTAMACADVTAYADTLRTVDGLKYRYSDSGEDLGIYTGWANASGGKVFCNKGVIVTKNTIINGVRYTFSSDGYLTGKYTGWTKSSLGRRCWNNGELVRSSWIKSGGYYYYAGYDGYITVEKVPEKFPALTPLTDRQKQTLLDDFIGYKDGKGGWQGITAEDLKVRSYYGTYNGCEAVIIWCDEMECTDDIHDIIIAGHTISLSSGSFELLLHRDGTFIGVEDAYKDGYLSEPDIAMIEYYSEH